MKSGAVVKSGADLDSLEVVDPQSTSLEPEEFSLLGGVLAPLLCPHLRHGGQEMEEGELVETRRRRGWREGEEQDICQQIGVSCKSCTFYTISMTKWVYSCFCQTQFSLQICCSPHWRQTQPLLRSNRAGVRWLSHRLWTRREESSAQRKVGGIAAKTSLDQLFVQYKCTVMDDINGHN